MFKTKRANGAMTAGEKVFSSAEVARLSEVSLRQLQWWDEQRVVSPKHEGHKRLYALEEVVEVSVIAELRRKGFSLQKIRRVLRFLQKEMAKRLDEILAVEEEHFLLTDGKSVYLEQDPGRMLELMKNARQAMFLISVTDQVRRLTATPRKPPKSEALPAAPARRTKAV